MTINSDRFSLPAVEILCDVEDKEKRRKFLAFINF